MSARLSCWLHGHSWGRPSSQIYEDLFGNLWRLQWCEQCSARRRRGAN